MPIECPDHLQTTLKSLGVDWIDLDEDELEKLSENWKEKAESLRDKLGDLKSDSRSVWDESEHDQIDTWWDRYTEPTAAHESLSQIADDFESMGVGVLACATFTVNAKEATIEILQSFYDFKQEAKPHSDTWGSQSPFTPNDIAEVRDNTKEKILSVLEDLENNVKGSSMSDI
ncbi:hypothetical protein [Salininema proteolyticum]|uniref:Uncharacterized protein n=1 Tax=Salininema proteolyticum TaxID=1607685 RepID=A0ABV8U2Y4_9ACTN